MDSQDPTLPRGLIVDDDLKICDALHHKFTAAGFAITVCHDAEQALNVLRSTHHQFAFVLTDLKMPGKDGFTILRELPKTPNAEAPIFVLTAFYEKCDEAKELGARRCFFKTKCSLAEVVKEISETIIDGGVGE